MLFHLISFLTLASCAFAKHQYCSAEDYKKIFMEPKQLESFLQIPADSDFPLHNIPFGVFGSKKHDHQHHRPATRIGNWVIDLHKLEEDGLLSGPLFTALHQAKHKIFRHHLNEFMSLDRRHWKEVRQTIQQLFSKGSPLETDKEKLGQLLHKIEDVEMQLPAKIGDYTDFYASRNHAFNVGSIIRGPENALAENWLHIPIGYHGRSSSVVVKGDVIRPHGQSKPPGADKPQFGECKRLDFELQIGVFVGGKTNPIGHPLKVNNAWENIFGLVLLNDWSFRDFQTWEYVPLGPFTAKNGITTISPWIVTLEALEDAKVELAPQEPAPLDYLKEKEHKSFDIALTVELSNGTTKEIISNSNLKYLYWSVAQQLSHHTVTGCPMKAGDLFGTGTISGPEKDSLGCLLEMTWGGKNPIKFGEGTRTFLQDGDIVTMRGRTKHGVGFGECTGKILPALPLSDYV